jgi:hypothetical protein
MALSRCSQRPTTVAGERRIFFYFPLDKSHFITVELVLICLNDNAERLENFL